MGVYVILAVVVTASFIHLEQVVGFIANAGIVRALTNMTPVMTGWHIHKYKTLVYTSQIYFRVDDPQLPYTLVAGINKQIRIHCHMI